MKPSKKKTTAAPVRARAQTSREKEATRRLKAPRWNFWLAKPDVSLRQAALLTMDAEVFVWRNELHWVGEEPDLNWVIRESRVSVPADPRGTIAAWKKFAKCFQGNHYLVAGLGAALSALLAGPLGVAPLSLVFVGRSAVGKSAMQSALQSIVRAPGLDPPLVLCAVCSNP